MARRRIAKATQEKVAREARHRCGYCLTPQAFTAMPMHMEHIIPLAAGGASVEENLWLACPLCNGHKGTQTHGTDPQSGEVVPLFDPRHQTWQEHFQWSEDGDLITGLTPVGRATIVALKLNNKYLVQARRRWVAAGWHP